MARKREHGAKWIRRTTRLAVYARDCWCCVYCGAGAEQRDVALTIDHVVPVTRGGTNHARNLVTCCKECNDSKGNLRLRTWARRWWEPEGVELLVARVRAAQRRVVPRSTGRVAHRRRELVEGVA